MCSPDVVVYVADGQIDGPVLVISCTDRYSSFIATEDNRAKDGAMTLGILSDNILKLWVSILGHRHCTEDLPLGSKPNSQT